MFRKKKINVEPLRYDIIYMCLDLWIVWLQVLIEKKKKKEMKFPL